jgi:hypothetical protein
VFQSLGAAAEKARLVLGEYEKRLRIMSRR